MNVQDVAVVDEPDVRLCFEADIDVARKGEERRTFRQRREIAEPIGVELRQCRRNTHQLAQCRRDYRAAMLYLFSYAVGITGAMKNPNERNAQRKLALIARMSAALTDWNCLELLDSDFVARTPLQARR